MRRRRLMAIVAGAFPSLDTAVNVAFPAIDEHFGLGVAELQWIVISYLLTYGALLVAAGRLGDAIGYRRLVWWGSVLSVIGLAGCATAPAFGVFLAGRVVQGVGTALVLAGAPALLTTSTHRSGGRGRGHAVGLFQAATMAGLTLGPAFGGPIVEYLGWRGVYWCRVPIALVLLALAHRSSDVPVSEDSRTDRIDRVEMALGIATIAGVVAIASLGRTWGWTDWRLIGLAGLTPVLAAGLVHRNRSTPSPTIDPALWRRPGFLRANLLNAIANGAVFPIWLLVPTLLVDERGIAVITSGLILAVSPALSSLTSRWMAVRVDSSDLDILVTVGLIGQACGMALLAAVGPAGGSISVLAGLAVVGIGLGIFLTPNMHQVMATLPIDRQGVAGGLSLMMRTVGIVLGVAFASAIFDPVDQASGFGQAFRTVFLVSAVVLGVLAAASARASRLLQADDTQVG